MGGAHRDQKRFSDSLEQQVQEFMSHQIWMLGSKLWSFGPVQEEEVFLTAEPSLQPPIQDLKMDVFFKIKKKFFLRYRKVVHSCNHRTQKAESGRPL